MTFITQDFRQQFPYSDFVVDDQDLAHVPTCMVMRIPVVFAGAAGSKIVTLAPPETSLATVILPLCSSTIFLTMASPNPVPFDLVVTYGSNTRPITVSGKPGPLSRMVSCTPASVASVRTIMRGTGTSAT